MSAAVTNSCLAQSGTSSRSRSEPPDARNSIRSSPVEAAFPRRLFELLVYVDQALAAQDVVLVVAQREQRLNAAGAPGDHRYGACRRYGQPAGVAHLGLARRVVDAALEPGEDAPPLGQILGHPVGLVPDEPHHVAAQLQALLGVVSHTHLDQHVGEAHHSQADLARHPGHLLDLVDRVGVRVDDVVPGSASSVWTTPLSRS